MPAIGIMTMIQSVQRDPSVMQASYKVSPAILDILCTLPSHRMAHSVISLLSLLLTLIMSCQGMICHEKMMRIQSPAQWTICCWEHRQQLVRLSWVDGGAFWLLCSNHLGPYTACITGLTCNLMDALWYESCETGQRNAKEQIGFHAPVTNNVHD